MNISPMDTPRTRAEFEHRFHLLIDKIKNKKMHFPQGYSFESLERVRKLPNGRIDFLNVDEQARLNANMMIQMQQLMPQAEFKNEGKL